MNKETLIQAVTASRAGPEAVAYRIGQIGRILGWTVVLTFCLFGCGADNTLPTSQQSAVQQAPPYLSVTDGEYRCVLMDLGITPLPEEPGDPPGMIRSGIRVNGTQELTIFMDAGTFVSNIVARPDVWKLVTFAEHQQ